MALYAFDGTWNIDEEEDNKDTNVVRFRELYADAEFGATYLDGVGSRFGAIGRTLGGLFGLGGRTRIGQMYDALCDNWSRGDKIIDIIGFSRGAALAVHFANKIAQDGVTTKDAHFKHAEIRFLGIWDLVASFGLSFDNVINFNEINLGWNIDTVADCVHNCYHAMALDERREAFRLTRLNPENRIDNIHELWFRGVHSDVGGGNENVARSNIALNWMLDNARSCGLPVNEAVSKDEKYSYMDTAAPISENEDIKIDERRIRRDDDALHETAILKELGVDESHTIKVSSALRFNWTNVKLDKDHTYSIHVAGDQHWEDGDITCGPEGWTSEQLGWIPEQFATLAERRRRYEDANWFELIGAYNDEDKDLIRVGKGTQFTAIKDGELYLFANDLKSKYGNNKGMLTVVITRVE